MAIKIVYVRPGTMMDIRVVSTLDETLDKRGWVSQNRPGSLLVTVHGRDKVEVHGHDIDTYGGRQCGQIKHT